jgi:hypothetical protein
MQPATSRFDYTADSYIEALTAFVDALGLSSKPYAVVVHGYILGQYGLLWALKQEDSISHLVVLNTPLATNAKLRPELAAYKSPLAFMRPKLGSKFAGDLFAAAGGPYAMAYSGGWRIARPRPLSNSPVFIARPRSLSNSPVFIRRTCSAASTAVGHVWEGGEMKHKQLL